jgi:two-component system, OmpR family, sensor histidine kinase MprB
MGLNWAEHFRSGQDRPDRPGRLDRPAGSGEPGGALPPWPAEPIEEQPRQRPFSPEEAGGWAEQPERPTRPGTDGAEADGAEADGAGADGAGADATGADGAGADATGADATGADGRSAYAESPRTSPRPVAWLRQISFRGRVSVLVAIAVALAVALAALSSYVAVSRQLEQQANANLQSAVQEIPGIVHLFPTGLNSQQLDAEPFVRMQSQTGYQVQVILHNAGIQTYAVVPNSAAALVHERFFKLTHAARATFNSPYKAESDLQTLQGADGNPYRVATLSIEQGGLAIMLGYPLSNIDTTLGFLRLMLILVAIGGVLLGAALGWAVGRASMRPVEELTLAAEHVAETQDLSEKIEDTSNDELGRLARSFNAMLAALSASRKQQAQLVSDAGHELRTPLTSLRTNIEVLMRTRDLPPADRDELLADVDAQLQELATMVGDLVDLARDEERREVEPELVAFDQLVGHAVERAKRRAMSLHFTVSLQPGYVRAQPGLLERGVVNILDNAAKWSPSGGEVGVRLWTEQGNWHFVVTDQGPGIPPEDLPRIFDRFYRAASARSMPGSGLGLAIVKRVVTAHGGTVDVACPPTGGTRVEIVLPLEEQGSSDNGWGDTAWAGSRPDVAESVTGHN